jgi:hypothetical protein
LVPVHIATLVPVHIAQREGRSWPLNAKHHPCFLMLSIACFPCAHPPRGSAGCGDSPQLGPRSPKGCYATAPAPRCARGGPLGAGRRCPRVPCQQYDVHAAADENDIWQAWVDDWVGEQWVAVGEAVGGWCSLGTPPRLITKLQQKDSWVI